MFARKPRAALLSIALVFLCSVVTAQVNCVPTYLKEYKATGDLMPYAIRSLSDGTFIVAGKGMLNATSSYDGMVVKLAGDGTVLWSYFIGGPGQDVFTGITPLSDGSFLLYGTTPHSVFPVKRPCWYG